MMLEHGRREFDVLTTTNPSQKPAGVVKTKKFYLIYSTYYLYDFLQTLINQENKS